MSESRKERVEHVEVDILKLLTLTVKQDNENDVTDQSHYFCLASTLIVCVISIYVEDNNDGYIEYRFINRWIMYIRTTTWNIPSYTYTYMAASSNCADYSGVHELDACGNGEVVHYQKVIQFPQRDSRENCDRVNPIVIRLKAKTGLYDTVYILQKRFVYKQFPSCRILLNVI